MRLFRPSSKVCPWGVTCVGSKKTDPRPLSPSSLLCLEPPLNLSSPLPPSPSVSRGGLLGRGFSWANSPGGEGRGMGRERDEEGSFGRIHFYPTTISSNTTLSSRLTEWDPEGASRKSGEPGSPKDGAQKEGRGGGGRGGKGWSDSRVGAGRQNRPREPKLGGPRWEPAATIPREDLPREKQNESGAGERGKKREILYPSSESPKRKAHTPPRRVQWR